MNSQHPIINIVYSVVAVFLCLAFGKLTVSYFTLLPASLYGMIFFTTALHIKLLNANRIRSTVTWCIKHMGVCFVPAGVGIINHLELVKQHGLTIVAITFITTFLLLTLVAWVYQQCAADTSEQV